MPLVSMTGFGSSQGSTRGVELNVEIRTVNHRFLDINCKLPQTYARFEPEISKVLRGALKRGRVDVTVLRSEKSDERYETKFNEDLFRSYVDITRHALKLAGLKEKSALPIALPHILFRREVLEVGGSSAGTDEDWSFLEPAVRAAVKGLCEMREAEGKALEAELVAQTNALQQIAKQIKELSEKTPQSFAERLKARLDRIGDVTVDPARLAQEVAILADRIDVTEELVRLESHLQQFRQVMSGSEGGRKLEFLLQEIGREINTTGSKSQNSEITTLVVEAKAVVEKLREQVLNIE